MITVLRCWVHENQRVFGDRLINNEDKGWLKDQLLSRCNATFQATEDQLFVNDRILFGDFLGMVGVLNLFSCVGWIPFRTF